jgi:dipeptidyl aminopeptidase/acylaminoacyl peptidase
LKGHLAPIEPICFVSRDHRVINGYLTLPLDRKRTNLPLIVVPHGGPWWRNVWGFTRENQEVQFFANRGYAVLQLNFRSSMGYGREFWTSGFKEWGQAMQNDVTDGVLWAIGHKIADPRRIAIVGESYGGYAALAGIAFTQEVHYVAAVDRAGISDLLLLFKEYQGYSMLPQLRDKIGDPDQAPDNEMLAKYSPITHSDRITTPLLIALGTFVQVVAPEQSATMYEDLKRQRMKPEIKYLPEGHIFQNEENLITYYETVDAFLKKHLR